jgi:hypothetical protein
MHCTVALAVWKVTEAAAVANATCRASVRFRFFLLGFATDNNEKLN